MKKPASLRQALTARIPEIRNEPERLKLWVEDGTVRARHTPTHGFALEYPLSVLLTEISTDIAVIAHAVNRWLRVNQPALLAGGVGESYKFEADILDNETADLMLVIPLTENVAITEMEDGSWQIDYLAEPDPLFDDGSPVPPNTDTPPLASGSTDAVVAD